MLSRNSNLSLFMLLIFSVSSPAQYYVNSFTGSDSADGSFAHPKRTIQAAIDICSSGNTVIVADGIYSGIGNHQIDFAGKSLILRSQNGSDHCIIDCQATPSSPHRAFTFDDNETTAAVVEGFTITGGYGWGAAIYCINSSPVIRHCVITENNSAGAGGAIALDHANPQIIECVITHNTAVNGGAIYCSNSSPTIQYCTISHNQAYAVYPYGQGGGICVEDDSVVTITYCQLNGNRASYGAAVLSHNSHLTIINSLITGNQADDYAGFLYGDNSTIILTNCTSADNYAYQYGGALRAYHNCIVTLTNCIFWHDRVREKISQLGSEIALIDGSTLNVSYSNIMGDWFYIYNDSSILNWDQTNLLSNSKINSNPLFAQRGFWDPNDTTENPYDDFWVEGDYRLLSGSPCVDRGSNHALTGYAYDLNGLTRMVHGLVDLGAYENGLTITKLTVKAGPNRHSPVDSFALSGSFDAAQSQFLSASHIIISVGPWHSSPLDPNSPLFKKIGSQPVYLYKRSLIKGQPGFLTALSFDFVKGIYSMVANNIDLSGLESPFEVTIRLGDNYFRSVVVGENLANGKTPLPISLMMGQKNTLRLYKTPKFRASTKGPGHDYLFLQGGISVADFAAVLTGQRLDMQWGTFSDFIPAQGWLANKTHDVFIYKKSTKDTTTPNHINAAQIDLKKCTFNILIKDGLIGSQPPPQTFTIRFTGFTVALQPFDY